MTLGSLDTLARAAVDAILARFHSGTRYLRLPELARPLPTTQVLHLLRNHDVRLAVFIDGWTPPAEATGSVTTSVTTAIEWRDDPTSGSRLLIVGDLERNRAAGLSSIRSVAAAEVAEQLLARLRAHLKNYALPKPLDPLLTALFSDGSQALNALSEYTDALLAADPLDVPDVARRELWRLGLLPHPGLDRPQIDENRQLVRLLRNSDAKTVASLAGGLRPASYAAVRAFAQQPTNRTLLRDLDFEEVRAAFTNQKSARTGSRKSGSPGGTPSVVDLKVSEKFDEDSFIEQVTPDDQGAVTDEVVIAGSHESWDGVPMSNVGAWLSPHEVDGYAGVAGGIVDSAAAERNVSSDEQIKWIDLEDLLEKLHKLERRLPPEARELPKPSDVLLSILKLRTALLPFVGSLGTEGVRLLYLSERVRETADQLMSEWVRLWSCLYGLWDALPDQFKDYAKKLAADLLMSDVRLEVDQSVVTAQLLPLHPVVIEPRVAAAKTLAAMGSEVDDRMVDLLCTNVDPGMPGISVNVNGTQQALSYAGRRSQLPYFQRGSHASEGPELARSLWTLTQRFMNVHPFTTFNLCVVMYRPSADLAKRYVRLLGEAATEHCELHVFTQADETEEVRQAIDSARADLTNRDIDLSKFSVSQHEDPGLASLTRQLIAEGVRPHLAFLFDLAASPADQFTQSLSTNLLPSVIAKWMFSVDPLDTKPVIVTQSGSGRLVEAGDLQRRLTSIGPPTQEHSPLLNRSTQEQIADLGQVATWVAVCESGSALSMPPRIRDLHMIGKSRVSTHVTFVYATQVEMLLEPVLALLQQNTWLQPGKSSLAEFLLGTVRLATPEGLLGFYKTEGRLSKDSVLGRLGVAAVLAYLERETEDQHLIISLDTDVAREWLNLRDDGGKRADLVRFSWSADGSPTVTAIEVKTRNSIPSTGSVPALDEALDQVGVMHRLFTQIFGDAETDALTPARREILKRQVFLDALHQWDSLRRDDEERYISRIDRLNQLFDADRPSRVSSCVFLVSTESGVEPTTESTGGVDVVRLGVEWLRDVLAQHDGTQVELPADLLEAFKEVLSGADEDDEANDAHEAGGPASDRGALDGLVMLEPRGTHSDGGDSDDATVEPGPRAVVAGVAQEEAVAELVVRLREVLVARKAPLKLIAAERVQVGPSVIQVPFKLAQGARLASLQSQEADISRELGVSGARISNWADEPGYAAIELPRRQREIPDIASLSAPEPGVVSLALGADLSMNAYRVDLSRLPHLLVGGTTGSGKSVFLRSLLWQLTHFWSSEEVSVVIIDAKGMADYIDFADAPQVTQFHPSVSGALEIIQRIVETDLPHRRDIFNAYAKEALDRGVRITDVVALKADAVARGERPPLGTLVVIVDEFAELVMGTADRKRFESLVTRFNQMARAIGGHLIAATQRPSTDIVTGVMKSNFARLALRVQSQVDSRVILDEAGAEVLQGRGDLLFRSAEAGTVRLQGYNALGPYSF
jgi:hypothetical protein